MRLQSLCAKFQPRTISRTQKTTVSVTCCPGPTDTNFVNRANVNQGQKSRRAFNMSPQAVARITVDSLFRRKPEVTVV
jgi:short-subunit dehydrogenase